MLARRARRYRRNLWSVKVNVAPVSVHNRARRRLSLGVLALAWACVQPPPDVGPLEPVRTEDTRVIRLMSEVDRDADRDPHGAARTIRELVLPVARANARACAAIRPEHPTAKSLASDLRSLLDERVVRLERYAAALDSGDLSARLREMRAQREMEDDMGRLERRFDAAGRVPATRGCARTP